VSSYGQDALTTSLVTSYDWFILPVVNPDGYEYSISTVIILVKDHGHRSRNVHFSS